MIYNLVLPVEEPYHLHDLYKHMFPALDLSYYADLAQTFSQRHVRNRMKPLPYIMICPAGVVKHYYGGP